MSTRPESEADVAAWLEDRGAVLLTIDSSSPVSGFPSSGDMAVAHGFLAGNASAELERMEQRRQRFGNGGPVQPSKLSDSDLEEFLESIKHDYTAGVISIAKHALKKSGWAPQPGDTENIPDKFINYLQILAVQAPCFEVINEDNEKVTYKEKDYNDLIDKAADLLEQAVSAYQGQVDVLGIKNSLTELAKSLTSETKKTDSICILSQHAIPVEPAIPGYFVFLTQATMTLTSGKANIYESNLVVYSLRLKFSKELWETGLYKVVGKKAYADAHDFFDDLDTPSSDSVKLCFE